MRFIHRIEQTFCFASVTRAQRSLFLRIVFLPIKIAVTPAIQSIFELHVSLHVEENARAEFYSLGSSRGVVAEFARIVLSALDLLAIPLAFVLPNLPDDGEAPRREVLTVWLQR